LPATKEIKKRNRKKEKARSKFAPSPRGIPACPDAYGIALRIRKNIKQDIENWKQFKQ